MKPESAHLLDAARELLNEAHSIQAINLHGQAGRTAYSAALLAARAFVYERPGRVVKTHRGSHNAFFKLTSGEPRIEEDLRRFLARAYELKDVVDYGVGPGRNVTASQARTTLETATHFVARIAEILDTPVPS